MSSQKKNSRLEGKDLITIGIYTVIYVVIVMLVAMLGFIPIFIPLMAVLCPLIGGIPYMLYVTKAKKFGMTAIMGFLIGLIMVFFGNGYLTMVTGLVGGLLADVILKKADYKSARNICFNYFRDKKEKVAVIEKEEIDKIPNWKDMLIEVEDAVYLKNLLKKLSQDTREVIILRIYEEMKFKDIAKIMGCSVSTTKSRFRLGINQLKKLMENDYEK